MDENMKGFFLQGRKLYTERVISGEVSNLHQISEDAGISYPTVHAYCKPAGQHSNRIQLTSLYQFLVDGLKMAPEHIANLRFGDVFGIVDENGNDITPEDATDQPEESTNDGQTSRLETII